jgi:predicted Zn-dependent protease
MRQASLLGLVLAAAVSMVLASTSVFGAQWEDYHWPSYNTNLGITNTASGEYNVAAAVSDWNQAASGTELSLAVNGGSDIEIRSKNMSAWYLGTAEILVDTSTDHILSGRVTLNHRYLREGNLYGFDASVRQHVLCQELGHVLGLDHQHGDSCMNDDNATLGEYTEPNQEDEDTLEDMYGNGQHTDTEPTTDNTRGGPPCSKNPSHPNCIPQGAVWITVHVIPSPVR